MACIDTMTIKIQVRIVRVERNRQWRWWKPWAPKTIEIEFSSLDAAIGKETT